MKKIINIKMLFAFFLLIGSMGMLAQQASASHLRGVTLSWSPTGVTRQVEFRFLYSQAGGTVAVGTNISVGINFGDGTSGTATGVVTSNNANDDYFVADLKVTKTYSSCGPFTAFYQSSARISTLRNGANGTIRMETIVTPCNGNRSPVVSLPPVVTVPVAGTVQFSVPASDADGNRLRYRLATSTESAVAQPAASTSYNIDANTGLVTWNTASAAPAAGYLYTSQIIVEDLDAGGNVISKVPVDFIIKFVAAVGSAPTLTINPAGPLTVSANQPVSFTVTGNDADVNSRVTLSASGMPTGAAMSPAIGAQLTPPVTSTFNWTPTTAQAGPTGNTYVINFSATDDTNRQVLKSMTINVLPVGAPTAASQSITATVGVPQNVILSATDPNGLAMTFSITGSPANGTVVLSGSPSCSVSGVSTCTQNATYTATAGYSGNDLFTFRASNGVQNSNAANVSITVSSNAAPTVNCPSNPAAVQYAAPNGATVPVTFQVADANADALTVQWKVDGNVVQTDNVAASNQPTNVTLSGQYAVGTHTVQVIVSDGKAAAVSSCTVQFSVTKANQTISFGALADKTYGDADFAVSATASSNLSVSFAASGNCTVSGNTVHITGAGSCMITASQTGDANFNAASSVSQSFNIAKAAVTIDWTNPDNITYGTALSGVQLNAAASFQNSPLTGSFDYTPTTGAVLNAGASQTLSVNFTPTDAANFNSATATVSINVLKAALTITADDKSKTYGDAPVSFTAGYSGFVNGDDASDLGGTLAFDFTDTTNTAAGTYQVTPSGLTSANYNIAYTAGAFTVSKAAITVTADNKSRVYGTTNPAFTGSIDGIQNSETITASYSTAANSLSDTGTYPIVPTLGGATLSNYEVTVNNGTLTVTKAGQTIVWSNPGDIIYGTTLGAAQLNAVVSGVTGGSAAGALSYTPAAGTLLNAGNGQALTVNAAATNNYEAASKTVYLNVLKATPVVNWSNPAAILICVPLGATQLNATASHPTDGGSLSGNALTGSFAYTPAAGSLLPAGNNPLSAVFTPSDTVNYTTASKSVVQRVNYKICALYDQTKAHKSGSTIPIKLQLCSAAGVNLSSSGVVVNAIGTRLISPTPWGEVEDAGNANPDNNFRFTDGMYMYNLQTKGLGSGVYQLGFIVGSDPTIYTVEFQIK